jgi:hypothetical protein
VPAAAAAAAFVAFACSSSAFTFWQFIAACIHALCRYLYLLLFFPALLRHINSRINTSSNGQH